MAYPGIGMLVNLTLKRPDRGFARMTLPKP
jgi:hypothetical protein